MPSTLIKGEFRIVGASPDGDLVRFYPTDPAVWAGSASGCDSTPAVVSNCGWTRSMLGFTGVERDGGGIVTTATPDARPGAVLTRFADQYGRAVAFVFADGRPYGIWGGLSEGERATLLRVPSLRWGGRGTPTPT